MNRRRFLAGCTACAAAGLAGLRPLAFGQEAGAPLERNARVRLVFLHPDASGPIWPNIGYDFEARMSAIKAALAAGCPGIDFAPAVIQNADGAKALAAEEDQPDGYLICVLGCTWTHASRAITATGRPAILADNLFGGSGEFLIDFAAIRRAGGNADYVSSSRLEDLVAAARCFGVLVEPGKTAADFLAACAAARKKNTRKPGDMTCPEDPVDVIPMEELRRRLAAARILVVGHNDANLRKAIQDIFGTEVVPVEFPEVVEAHAQADRAAAAALADNWITAAEKVIEPTRGEIEKSAAMYLAMRSVMEARQAGAIAVNCLGGFYGGFLDAYPCLGFCQLNNDGLVGACEADLYSTITMLAMSQLTGRPGFISDPVIDTAANQIIYAHCVATSKVFGPQGPSNPYHIRSHSEDRKGAAVRSLMPLGRMTTTIKIHPFRKEVIFHQGKSVANVDEDMACRTKLAVEVKGDIDKLMNEWDRWSWHRVTFFGDLRAPVEALCQAYGLTLVEEA